MCTSAGRSEMAAEQRAAVGFTKNEIFLDVVQKSRGPMSS